MIIMENLLIMGIDTRPMVNSALKLDYKTFSISYFKTVDFKMPNYEKHVLDQESVISCGRFEDNYSPDKLLDLFEETIIETDNENDEIDKIVLTTGLNTNNFSGKFKKYRKIVRGNNNQFILKPLQGSGGLGIFLLNNESSNKLKQVNEICQNISLENYILQEYIEGTNVSSSVLSSHNERKNLINSRLITEHDLGNESYEYSGNILPLDENSFRMFNDNRTEINADELNDEMKNTSEDLIKQFNLIGSNGVDYILDKDGELKIIEINPRFQGTYELVENSLGINLLDAHIKACEGEIIDIPNPSQY